MEKFTLHNNTQIPCIGFGTWDIANNHETVDAIKNAIANGFTHIDTAARYYNEESIGIALEQSSVKREQLWITSKVWPTECGYDNTIKSFNDSLKRLKTNYLDLFLIHWPASSNRYNNWQERNTDTWRALETLYNEGKVKAIGVSNFLQHHLEPLFSKCNIKPMVNQIEVHPGYTQAETVKFCQENGLVVEAWSPFGKGRVFGNDTLEQIATKHGKSVAQICIKWCLQKHIVPLPKSVTPERMRSNIDVFDFQISDTDMSAIDAITTIGWSGQHPDEVTF